jgi:uncharacterized protein YbcI
MATDEPDGHAGEQRGGSMLSRISLEMVRLQKQYYGRGPDRAKSYMLDDLLFIVMRGGVLPAEQTMLDSGQEDLVRNFRQQFENEMGARIIGMVEELTGRKVLNYQSQVVFDPDVVVEMFIFDDRLGDDQVRDTAEGQLTDESIGEVSGDDVDVPAENE